MGRVFHVPPEAVSKILSRHATEFPKYLHRAMRYSSVRSLELLQILSPEDLGIYKKSWRRFVMDTIVVIENNAPHAGIIELGARPHAMSREGIERLMGWVKRKLLMGLITKIYVGRNTKRNAASIVDEMAKRIAFAIAHKFRTRGQRGKYIVRNHMEVFSRWLVQDVVEQLNELVALR